MVRIDNTIYRDKPESIKGISLSGNACIICGWAKKDYAGKFLVEGAHVRMMRNTRDYDKFDNIIALCPNHHTEFDRGNIAFDISKNQTVHLNTKDVFHKKRLKGKMSHIKKGYIDYHNKRVFKGRQFLE